MCSFRNNVLIEWLAGEFIDVDSYIFLACPNAEQAFYFVVSFYFVCFEFFGFIIVVS